MILMDCSHFLHDEKPEEVTKYILRFLNDIDAKVWDQSAMGISLDEDGTIDVRNSFYDQVFPQYIVIDDDAMFMDECVRDFKMVYEKRDDAPLILAPFRGHKGVGILHALQYYLYFRHFSSLKKFVDTPKKKTLTEPASLFDQECPTEYEILSMELMKL